VVVAVAVADVIVMATVKNEYANEGIAADGDHRRLHAFLSIALSFARSVCWLWVGDQTLASLLPSIWLHGDGMWLVCADLCCLKHHRVNIMGDHGKRAS
jgi:hypothetical protein